MKALWISMVIVVAAGAMQPAPLFARDIRAERVHFKPGASSATIKGRIKGDAVVDYILGARKGQSMNVSMATDNGANYFNIMAPGEKEVALFNGSVGQNQFEGILPDTGDYTVRVYLMRSAARRNEVANYRLEMIIGAGRTGAAEHTSAAKSAATPAEPVAAATRAGQGQFDASGQIPCAQHAGQPMGQCPFGVTRSGGGTATVVVTKPDGRTRALFFVNGKFSTADTSQADGNPEASATRDSDLNMIRVGNERYEVPDAVIFGG